ncbi:MAG TPA: type 2 isopentenyl-diphosphate Delta-isomerase [Thermoplasmata archaeon]|nr:type 2 isopentenyl-diphosphate Delta-isomerase [Thermoplasmata archaeon]
MARSRGRSGGSRSTGAGRTPDPASPPDPTGLDLSHRKAEHVKVVLGKDVEGRYRYWDDVQLVHRALPELDFTEIDPSVELLGHRLKAPIVITGMTGGFPDAAKINENLARAAAEVGVAMGVGSERAAVLKGQYPESYAVVARHAVPLKFANIGAPQIIPQRPGDPVVGPAEVRAALDLIHADVLAIHLNFLQEMVQPEGDRRARGALDRIAALAQEFPVLVKETGAGISEAVARQLKERGVRAFDVSGTGGTSFAAVEHYRAVEQGAEREARVGRTFWDWGIPSPVSVLELVPLGLPVVASGGVRSGLDVARAIALGATAAGTAGGVLRAASTSFEATRTELELLVHELKVAMFLTGSRTVADLQKAPYVLTGETRPWLHR